MHNKTQLYHEILSPKLKEIFDICKAEGIPFFAAFVTAVKTETVEIYTTQVVSELEDIPSTFVAAMELFNNPDYAKVCVEILELQLMRKAIASKLEAATPASATLQ